MLFAFNVIALMIGNFVNTRVVPKVGSRRMLFIGLALAFIAGGTLLTVSLMQQSLYFIVFSIAPLMMSLGIIASNADALILMEFERNSGTATAVIGLRFGSALVGLFRPDPSRKCGAIFKYDVQCLVLILTQFWHHKKCR